MFLTKEMAQVVACDITVDAITNLRKDPEEVRLRVARATRDSDVSIQAAEEVNNMLDVIIRTVLNVRDEIAKGPMR